MGREWINRPSSKVTEEIIRQSSCAAIRGPQDSDSRKRISPNPLSLGKRLTILATVGSLAAACGAEGKATPTPINPTPDNPNPLPTLVDKTPTPFRPTPTEAKTPTPEATPTVIAINIPPARGPITEATPTPDTLRETLTGKAKLYYEKNPLIVKGSQLNGILVSERTSDNKILISIRTFTGAMENAVLAGNWGYFSVNDKSEITGIIWAKQDTFTDSKGKTGYLGDSAIATAGAGFFGAKQVGYWTKKGDILASLDPQTGNPMEIRPIPTATKTPEPKPTVEVIPTTESAISVREILAECPVQVTFGGAVFALHPQVINLPLSLGNPIVDIKINPTPAETLGLTSPEEIIKKVVLYIHWRAWQYEEGNKYLDQRKGVTFEDYQKMVDQGGDVGHKMWVITKKGEALPNEEVVISPKTKIVTVYVNALKIWGDTSAILYDKGLDTLIFKDSPAELDPNRALPRGYRIWVSGLAFMAEDPLVMQKGSTARKSSMPNRISEIGKALIPDLEHATKTPFLLVIK